MIFVVVGTQEPFDRMVKAVDEWAGKTGYKDIFGQISKAEYTPANFEYREFIDPEEFNEKFRKADVILSHAGMGTIIQALQFSKPIIVMPRLSQFNEQRNDHQVATARSFGRLGYVKVVNNDEELFEALNNIDSLKAPEPIGKTASESLLKAISGFINS